MNHGDRSLDDARERGARDAAKYRSAWAWLGVLLAGLVAAGGLAFLVYSAFQHVFDA